MKKIIALLVLAFVLTLGISAESGDLNGDGKENLLDVITVFKQAIVENPSISIDLDGHGIVIITDCIALLARVVNAPENNVAIDVSNKFAFTATGASWSYINGQLVVNSTTGTDGFAISNVYVPGGTSFEVEATMQITSGNCGGITFGVAAPISPSAAWYCVNVDKAMKLTRLFSVGTGTAGTASTAQRTLTAAELAKDTFTIKVQVTERGKISFYIDGGFVASYDEPDFAGGYIGFNSFKSRAVFKNIKIRTGENSFNESKAIDVVSGNWNYSGGVVTATNAANGDCFAMTDIYVPAKTAFKIDATIKGTVGNKTGGIVFGVKDKAAPASGWYCLNVAVAEKRARLFGVKVGTISGAAAFSLSNEKLAQGEYAVSLEVGADGIINCYLDGELVITGTKADFAGGYIGFNTYKSDVVFSDISITVDGVKQTLGDMSLSYGEKSIDIDVSQTYHDIDLGDYSGKVTIKADLPRGYTARVGTTAFVDGEYTFTPEYGKNTVKVDIRDKYARKSTVTIELWRDIPADLVYSDTYRPKYHVTPPINFMNDPNGLFYNEITGEYHAYYQWNPTVMKIGNQVWGHASSKDLLNWTDYGIAIDRPDDGDCIYSGCAVVDKDNTSGLFDESVAPENRVVAIYTVTGPVRQELAYSTDGGYTFTKYENNPIIASSAYFASFRDPKVQWIEEKGLWLMVIAGGPMELYTSPDLINWTSQGTMKYLDGTTIESECPMLLALPLDGDESNIKYVYVGSGRFYVVGDLVWEGDTVKFVAEQTKNNTMFHADAHYATQDFYNDASGRTLVMSWMRDNKSGFLLDNKYWHGMQSMPYVTSLVTENGQMVLKFEPIEEIEGIKGDALCEFADVALSDNAFDLADVNAVYGIFDLCAKLEEGAILTLSMREGDGYATTFTFKYLTANTVEVTMDTKNSGPIARIAKTATVTCDKDGYFSLYALLDNSVIEAFTSDGKVFADFIFPTADGISLTASGNVLVKAFSVYETNEESEMVDISYTDIVERMISPEMLSMDSSGETTGMFSSYDRTSQYSDGEYSGWRANNDGGNVIGTTEDGGQLLADITGGGYISRIWSATSGPGHVKVIVDGEVVIDLPFTDYFNCNSEPFNYKNLVYEDAARGKNNYIPISFSQSCKVVAYGGFGDTGWGKYYHINYTVFPEGTRVESMPVELSALQKEALSKVDKFFDESIGTNPLGHADADFETFTVSKSTPFVKTLVGEGAISGLLARVELPKAVKTNEIEAINALKDLRIRIYWDGSEKPLVDAPLGDFFANGYGYDYVKTLLVGVREDNTLYNYYYMPYLESAKIEIFTVGEEYSVSLSVNTVENTIPEDKMLYFGAQFDLGNYHEDAMTDGVYDINASRNPDYRFLSIDGKGKFVGLNLHLYKAIDGADPISNPGQYWWGEGDEKFFVDGEDFPSWYGTGTEDFFGYAWGDSAAFTKAYHAQSYCYGGLNGIGNRMQTRILLGDSVAFDESFEGYLEKYYRDDYVRYGFTSYFYASNDSYPKDVRYDANVKLGYYMPEQSAYRDFLEGEELELISVSGTGASIGTQEMSSFGPAWSKNTQLLFKGFSEGATATFTLPSPGDGEYVLLASFTTASDFATLQLSVNGSDVGAPIDTYGSVVAVDNIIEVGTVVLSRGYNNTLTVSGAGKNSASKGYFAGLDFILLIPASEYNGISELDLSAYTSVLRCNTKRDVTIPEVYNFEGETTLLANAWGTAGTLSAQTMTNFGSSWSGGKQLLWKNTGTANASMRAFIWVEESGEYQMKGAFTTAVDFGIFTMSINGATVGGQMDFYSKGVLHSEIDFGTVNLKAGYNKIVFRNVGKNASSTGYLLGVDYLSARKTK